MAGIAVVAIRVSFTGDLGWELHCAEADQVALYEALVEAGRAVGAGPVGSRALMSLRLEKGYGSWGRDFSPEYWPQESGLDGLIRSDKEFLNMHAWLRIEANAPREEMVMLEIGRHHRRCQRVGADLSARWHAGRTGLLWRLRLFRRQVAGAGLCQGGHGRAGRYRPRGDPRTPSHGATARRSAFRSRGATPARKVACRRACGLGRRALK